jgi:hypothetical protein
MWRWRARRRPHLMVPQRFYVTQQGEFGDRHLCGAMHQNIGPSCSLVDNARQGVAATSQSIGRRLEIDRRSTHRCGGGR